MRKFLFTLLTIAFFGALNQGYAQMKVNKLGYVNSIELLEAMPEKKPADEQLEKYAGELNAQLDKMYLEYQKKAAELQSGAQQKTLSEIEIEMKSKELSDMQSRIQEFEETANEKIARKRNTLYQPIVDKINEAIKAVAKDNGYTYIFDSSAGSILFAEESDNLIDILKKKLNIPLTAPAAPATAPKAPVAPK